MTTAVTTPTCSVPASSDRASTASALSITASLANKLATSLDFSYQNAGAENYQHLVTTGALSQAIDGATLARQAATIDSSVEASRFVPQIDRLVRSPLAAIAQMPMPKDDADQQVPTTRDSLYSVARNAAVIARHLDPAGAAG